ncbi:hypothetical protein LCGC14_1882830 [marine sediment metagenome]|uniref:Uncharacterized protein n=1 Tax=marine sediment metagenome TaxID=412755 RepID=A0A0F9G1N5_9ZZZZ
MMNTKLRGGGATLSDSTPGVALIWLAVLRAL